MATEDSFHPKRILNLRHYNVSSFPLDSYPIGMERSQLVIKCPFLEDLSMKLTTYVAEDQPRCPTRPPMSRSAVLPCPPSLAARLGIQYSPVSVLVTYEFRDV